MINPPLASSDRGRGTAALGHDLGHQTFRQVGIATRPAQPRDMGVRIAIEDFGTGYSSLSYLQRFAVDTLKIDKSFIDTVGDGGQAAALVEGIIGIAHTLGLDVVAEGIEYDSQRERLRELGCDLGQGYLFAKPLPGSEMVAFLNASRERSDAPVALQPGR